MIDLDELKNLGIDTEEGLACCTDDIEFYEEMLDEYRNESWGRAEELNRCFEKQDWKNYGIFAHSIKNMSHMIGAIRISQMARELELAAKENDQETIIRLHPQFIPAYTELTEKLESCFN